MNKKRQSDKSDDSGNSAKKQKANNESEVKALPTNPSDDELEKVTGLSSECWQYFWKLKGHRRVYCRVENKDHKHCNVNYNLDGVRLFG